MTTMMKSIARLLTLVAFFCAWSTASALYFPQSDLSIRVPSLGKSQLGSGIVLLSARTLNNDSSVPVEATYQILPLKDKSAALVNGSVVLLDAPRRGSSETIVVQATGKAGAEAFLEIKVLPQYVKNGKINCTDYVQDICFWNSSRYRIYENQPTTMLGTLGPSFYQTLCPQFFKPEYDLLNGTEFFHLSNDRLWANASLDRDSWDKPRGTGPRSSCEVRCVIWDETTGIQYTREKVLHVDVLDENDNPPVSQTNTSVHIYLKDFLQGDRLDEQDLIFKDADDVSTNTYDIRLLEDHHNALNLVWNTMSVDHPKMPPSTAIFARLYSKTTLLPKSPYHVILQVTDVSLLPGYGNNTINITLSLMGPQHYTSTTAPSNHPDGLSALTASKKPGAAAAAAIVYPQETILVSRYSGQYYRITQPLLAQRETAAVQFSLRGPKAFNVTSKGGIVYVADPQALAAISNAINLRIEWKAPNEAKPSSYAILSLKIVDLTDACKQNPANGRSCANAKTAQECQGRCGVAAGGNFSNPAVNSTSQVNGTTTTTSGCAWRSNGNGQASSTMTEKYETCSANLKYCPDNVCDELEYLDLRICPQDCAIETELRFAEVNKAGRGIKRGFGTCWCEDFLICTCGSSFRDMPMSGENSLARSAKKDQQQQQGRDKPTTVDVQQAAGNTCGTSCLIGVSVACSFAFVSFMAIFCFWRTRIVSKVSRRNGGGCMRRGSSDTDAHGLGILPQDYVERGAAADSSVGGNGLLIGLDSMTAINRSLMPPKSLTTDPKWEFPRARLQIEQVLGEGEFGRVLRAKAHDIAGQPGVQTVAVKTLKECANSGELADLLSEYELLKDVKHPNVIRLLGACTGASGPVYLIIEFAEYGSLRNYLRKSRHLDTDGRLPCAMAQQLLSSSSNNGLMGTTTMTTMDETSLTSSNESITPRDIISFAWQISKGMAYLADVKLVHRDLAARNVLLAAGRQCKISDFGLTRDIYEDDAYLKRSKGRVPVKWMAPESLADHVYTSKSDVWSFGILLWELITLGASPYPGVDVHNLYNLLKSGYRMDRPANCSTQLYKLMTSCWHDEPGLRPSFKELALVWEGMLEAAADYLQLAQPRMVHNQAYFTSLNPLDSPRSTASSSGEYEQPRKIPRSVAASAASTVIAGGNGSCSSRSSNNSDSIKRDFNGLVVVGADESDKDTAVNYLNKPLASQHHLKQQQLSSKCDKVDKLEDLWQVDHRLRHPSRSNYVNESAQEAYQRHYESPIRLRNRSVASSSENESTTTPTGPSPDDDDDDDRLQAGGRPQSYIDMQSGTAAANAVAASSTTTAADNGGAKMKLAEAESLLMSFGGGSEIGA